MISPCHIESLWENRWGASKATQVGQRPGGALPDGLYEGRHLALDQPVDVHAGAAESLS